MIEKVIKRDGRVVDFDGSKIANAIIKAGNAAHEFGSSVAEFLAKIVITELEQEHDGEFFSIEIIQNKIEHVLMRKGFYESAKAFIIYRERRRELRDLRTHMKLPISTKRDGFMCIIFLFWERIVLAGTWRI
jgi:anaerobic ribonucleoside-triphosphate reductase